MVAELAQVAEHYDVTAWNQPLQPGKWSPAAMVLHVCRAYEFGREAVDQGATMRLLVPKPIAWASRTLLLPWFLRTKRFPRGVRAPREVVPDLAEAAASMKAALLVERLQRASRDASEVLRRAAEEQRQLRIGHAYFGPLTPLMALLLLTAHTRHHTRALSASGR